MKFASPVLDGYPVQEFTLGNVPGDEFDEIPVVRWAAEKDVFLSRLVLTEEERRRVAETGELYLFHYSVRHRFLPVRAQLERPAFSLPVFSVEVAGETPTLFDGFDVREAGGNEDERLEYARGEAAQFAVEMATLPCRVALCGPDIPWLEGGGQESKTRAELEQALGSRLSKLPFTDKRVELHDADGTVIVFSMGESLAPECIAAIRTVLT